MSETVDQAVNADAVVDLNRRTNEWIRRLATVVAALMLVLQAVSYYALYQAAETNKDLLGVVLAVTGCTVEDTAEECQRRQVERATQGTSPAIIEIDCRAARREIGLLPPDPLVPCVQQTDPSVFPGAGPDVP